MKKIPWQKRVYALYKGDDFITEGTLREISEETGKSISHLKFMTYPSYEKRCGESNRRLRLINLDDEEEE